VNSFGWRWCRKCQGLFFWGAPNPRLSLCPVSRELRVPVLHDGSQSPPFVVRVYEKGDENAELATGWRMCRKCNGLFWTRRGPGACPAGETHDGANSPVYSLRLGDGSPRRCPGWNPGFHAGWNWCRRCQGLFFADGGRGSCPAGGCHDGSQSSLHALRYDVAPPVTRWQWDNLPIDFGDARGLTGVIEKLVIRPNGTYTVVWNVSLAQAFRSTATDYNVTLVPGVVDCWNHLYPIKIPPVHVAGIAGSGPGRSPIPGQQEGTIDEIQDNWKDLSPGATALALASAKLDYVNFINSTVGILGLVVGVASLI